MTTFVYRCPNTTLKVQGFPVDEVPDGGAGVYYMTVTCTACRGASPCQSKDWQGRIRG